MHTHATARNEILRSQSLCVAQIPLTTPRQERLPSSPKTLPQNHKILGYRPKILSQKPKHSHPEPERCRMERYSSASVIET